jgi:cell cycle checkpoint protein
MTKLRRSARKLAVSFSDNDDEDTPDPKQHVLQKKGSKINQAKIRGESAGDDAHGGKGDVGRSRNTTVSPQSKSNKKGLSVAMNKPIYSFFNAVTQRQNSSQPSASPERLPKSVDDLETIQDEFEDEDIANDISLPVSTQGSSIALAMRKRKSPLSQDGRGVADNLAPASLKFRKTSNGSRLPTPVLSSDGRPWMERFGPLEITELAVHKRKVADVRQWLEHARTARRQQVLVLKGPAGTGKTMTVKLLTKELGISLIEWKSSVAADADSGDARTQSAQFEDFIGRAGKSTSLSLSSDAAGTLTPPVSLTPAVSSLNGNQALLIEEFPSTFSRSSNALQYFRSSILQFLASDVPRHVNAVPIVMVISETSASSNTAAADSFTAHRLLGPELGNHPYVNVIEFNPVAPTILIKALELVVVKESRFSGRRKTPGPLVLQRLAETGDIRSAVCSLEFLCLRGDEGDTWSSKVAFTKTKKAKSQSLTEAEEQALKLISNRESSLGIFHSVGKVVYNKRVQSTSKKEPLPGWLSQYSRNNIPETDADELYNELGTDVMTFLAALHENYALSCNSTSAEQSLECMHQCLEQLSDADLLSIDQFAYSSRVSSGSAADGLRQDELCFQVAVRGLLFSLPNPVHRATLPGSRPGDSHKMLYPASLRLWRKQEETTDRLKYIFDQLCSTEATLDLPSNRNGRLATPQGVESWRSNALGVTNTAITEVQADQAARYIPDQKLDLLLDRLPYMARILPVKELTSSSQSLVNTIALVTKPSGSELQSLPETVPADEADDDFDSSVARAILAIKSKSNSSEKTPFGAPKISGHVPARTPHVARSEVAEVSIGSLVLEDDDIVDD